MDALERLLRPVTRLANRQIRMSTPARELCAELKGSVIAVRVQDTALAMYFHVHDQELSLSSDFDGVPDVVISGSLLNLARLAGESGEAAVRDGSVELTGDATLARSFQQLLRFARPDLEEELSGIVGDVAAHGLGDFARSLVNWTRNAGATLRQNASEYLQEESGALPSRHEFDRFSADVERTRDDVARIDARLKRIEETLRTDRERPRD